MSGRSKGPSLPERHNPQDEEGSRHHFGSFKLYMQYKNEKLQVSSFACCAGFGRPSNLRGDSSACAIHLTREA